MIVKKCILNFLKSLRHYLPAVALLTIGLLIGIAGFINVARHDVNTLLDLVDSSVAEGTSLNVSAFKTTVVDEFKNLPWNNFWEAINQLFSRAFLENTISKAVIHVIGEDKYTTAVSNSVGNVAESITKGFVTLFVWGSIGILASYIYSKIMVKQDLKMKVPFKKTIVVVIVSYVLNITLVALATWLIGLFPIGTLLTLLFMVFMNQALALFKAYLSRTQDSLKFKKIFTFKNISLLTLGTICMLIILIIMLVILIGISNQVVGLILALPLYFILSAVIGLNAYSYVKDYYSDLRK
ncbi:MAG: hypothetical protein K6G28_04140 [Acholeplasmatales bacterium]|nr:hypothetical protein [Acholeplasmatales bacterium]